MKAVLRRTAIVAALACAAGAAPALAPDDARSQRETLAPTIDYGKAWDSNEHCRVRPFRCGRELAQAGRTQAALPLLRQAARGGSAEAMRAIGLIYLRGEGDVAPDPAEAAGWFYEAALARDAEAMFLLGAAFQRGLGVARDEALARFWFMQAAENGSRRAREILAGGAI